VSEIQLTEGEEKMLAGERGHAVQKSMEILVALAKIYGAERLVEVSSVQVSGVSYKNLGDAGLEFLTEIAKDGHSVVKTTLNPAGMSLTGWKTMGISEMFAERQMQVIRAYEKLGIETTCTCTPYLAGNKPSFGQHIAWSESSAVVYANSVLGARTNREGGPSALAASLTGRTPLYGYHLDENRRPTLRVDLEFRLTSSEDFSAMGYFVGQVAKDGVPYFKGIPSAVTEEFKALSAALASSGGIAMFQIEGVTPEAKGIDTRTEAILFTKRDLTETKERLKDNDIVDFVSVGCPHCTLNEIGVIAEFLDGRKVTKEFWICCSKEVKRQSDESGYSKRIEKSGAKFATDTCMVVAPVEEMGYKAVATNSAKACHYLRNGGLGVKFMTLHECVQEALGN